MRFEHDATKLLERYFPREWMKGMGETNEFQKLSSG
jgi:hypothetical protein